MSFHVLKIAIIMFFSKYVLAEIFFDRICRRNRRDF